jgi:hypothetical protein
MNGISRSTVFDEFISIHAGFERGIQNSCAMAFSLLNSARTVMRFYLHLQEPITDNPVIN